uniref:Proto-oncogene tyrosine-protein kinase ROS-like n=1 Tax=Saccoglossus kowalevskii TaxID=10224 RepID=A0ABM0LYR5_SACKO
MSVPSIPENCRYFTTVNKDIYKEHIDIFADIRWETPTVINGLLLGYHIYVSLPVNDTIIWYNMTVGSDVNRYILPNLTENSIYNVQIDAFTAIGNGESSQVMIIDTQVEKPAPKLLVVENDGIMEQDVDSGNTNIISSTEEVLFVGYIFHSSQLLWVDADTVYLDSKQLVSGLSVPQGFAVDWIGQAIYWTQNDNTGGSIHYYNLNSIEQIKTTEIVKTVVDVGQIVVDPYHSTILWIEETEISVQLMKSGLHGERPAVASNGRRHRDLSEHCNCQANITIGHVFTIDQSDANNPWLYWSDGNEGHLWRSDTAICQCQKLFDVNSHPKSGLPPDSLTVDHQSVYWTNDIQGLLNSVDKDSGDNFQSHDATGISVVLAYGSNLQPMPDLSCLSPEPYNNSIINVWSGRYELTLSLIPTRWPAECVGLSKATLVYTLYYAPVDSATTSMTCDNGLSCKTKESEDTNITISDLQPYTYYVVQVAVSNIYTQTSQQLSKHYMYATQPGAGLPDIPEIPYFKEYANGIWQVEWMEPENNGAEILNYDLQYLRMSQEYNITSNWTTAYNETDAFWVISDLEASSSYKFRVCAINEIGQSDFSGLKMPTKGDSYELIIIIAAAVVALVIIVIILLICLAVKKRKEKQTQLDGEVVIHFDPDQELATLRAYPNNTIRQSNWNYGNLDLNVELPLFPRERLKLVTFLGSGAFGEVFEGLALDIMGDNSGETKVAVKTLRKGATDQEKEEFLKEAQLM